MSNAQKASNDLSERGVEVLRRLSVAKVSLSDASFIAQWVSEARTALRAAPTPDAHSEVGDLSDDIAEILFNQRQTNHVWSDAIEADLESDAGTLASICRDDAKAVLSHCLARVATVKPVAAKILAERLDEHSNALINSQFLIADLQNALRVFVRHYDTWMEKHGDYDEVSSFSRHTFGELRHAKKLAEHPSLPPVSQADVYGVYLTRDGRFMDIASSSRDDAIEMAEAHYDISQYVIRPLYAASAGAVKAEPVAWLDVIAERQRQVSAEGWTPEHDDNHTYGEMASAAACYALGAHALPAVNESSRLIQNWWPWAFSWWKPAAPRRMLVKAGALILAEIERLDRSALASKPEGERQIADIAVPDWVAGFLNRRTDVENLLRAPLKAQAKGFPMPDGFPLSAEAMNALADRLSVPDEFMPNRKDGADK